MELPRFTLKSQEVIEAAQGLAAENNNPALTSLHLLAALLNQKDTIIEPLLNSLGANQVGLSSEIVSQIEKLPKSSNVSPDNLTIEPELRKVLDQSGREAKKLEDEYISVEHLLLSLIQTDSPAQKILLNKGLGFDTIANTLKSLRGNQKITDDSPETKFQVLDKYARNLTKLASEGKIDPVIGRDEEVRRVMQILSRRTKNNPVLLGDPGVGKTAIVEGLAQRIVSGDVPDTLRNREILYLDMASLVAGTAFRGEFEDRIKKLINEIEKSEGRYILFMDELHTLVGAGSVQGAMDAANILKPALARGGLHAIGATTLREYRRHIENDAALERRFQPVNIDEPSQDDSLAILRGIKEKYEVHHGIRITDDALIAAVNLSVRYIADRFLPDKAIDLIDEAASGLKIEAESLPDVLDVIKRKITRLEIELASFKKDEGHQARKKKLETEIKNLKNEENRLNSDWQEQKKIIGELQKLRVKIDSLKSELETAERQALLEKAAEIKYGRIPEAEKNLNRLEVDWNKIPEDKRLIREEVTEEDVARVVSRWTGIPVTRLLKSESEKLINLEREIHKRLIDQEEAVSKVSRAIRRNRAGLGEEEKPIGSFLFLGPTGVGKTETAKALAEYLFSDEKALVRIDMSEYQEAHNIARMIGAPPGYVGFEEGGQLTEAVRRKPYSIVLLDEIEEVQPDLFNV